MTTASLKAKIVNIAVERGSTGLLYATSPDLKGLLVAEPTREALNLAIPKAITDLYLACGVRVVVTPVETEGDDPPWVAIPLEWARLATELAKQHS